MLDLSIIKRNVIPVEATRSELTVEQSPLVLLTILIWLVLVK